MAAFVRLRLFGLALGSMLAMALTARGAGTSEALLSLVPPDAAATLAIEDLRGQARAILTTPLAEGFQKLPAFQAWIASDRFARWQQARERIEGILGTNLATIRDELLGDAVVLTLRVPPNGRPEDARGLFLSRVRDRALLDRLLREVNDAQQRSGELARLVRSTRNGVSYWTREFRAGSQRPTDYFTVLEDHTFAWSNAEDLIRGVIDRRGGQARSLADDPRFRRVRRRLPEPASVSLFVDPRYLEQLLAASARPRRPVEERASAMLGRYLGAMQFFGATLQWRDGLLLQTEEILDPQKLDPWLRSWASRPVEDGPDLRRLPTSALVLATLNVDFPAWFDALRDLVPERQQPRMANLVLALDGVLLGHDLRTEILPQLGPGVLFSMEPPTSLEKAPDARLSRMLIVKLGKSSDLTAALANALQTYLAVYALDSRHGKGQLQVETRTVEGRKITSLRPSTPLAFAIDGDRLILGSTADAVARALAPAVDGPEDEFERLRAARFPESGSFVYADLTRLHQYVLDHREPLVARLAARQKRPAEGARRDLDQAVALLALFRQFYMTTAIEPDATAVHRSMGLIVPSAAP